MADNELMSKGTTYWLKVPALHNIHEQAATAGSRVVLHLAVNSPLKCPNQSPLQSKTHDI